MTDPPQFILRDCRVVTPRRWRAYFLAVRALAPTPVHTSAGCGLAPEKADPDRFAVRVADGRRTLVAVDADGCVLDFVNLEANCHPDAAGNGIASRIVEALLDHARTAGITDLHVEASELTRDLFTRHSYTLVHRGDFALAGVPIHITR